jgi:hypothetical protein
MIGPHCEEEVYTPMVWRSFFSSLTISSKNFWFELWLELQYCEPTRDEDVIQSVREVSEW